MRHRSNADVEHETLDAEDLPLNILYEDNDLVVIDKAAGMVVHPAAGHSRGTLVNALLFHVEDLSGVGGELRPGIVHRLDRGTSGVMVAAKNDAAHAELSRQFHDREVEKEYIALVWGLVQHVGMNVLVSYIGSAPAAERSTAMGLFSFITYVAVGLGGGVYGSVYAAHGFFATSLAATASLWVGAGLVLLFLPKTACSSATSP